MTNKDNKDNKNITITDGKDGFRYMEFHGKIEKDIRTKNKLIYNDVNNKNGKLIKIILLSPAGAEGINLENVRQIHIMEPFWNEVRIEQIIGRGIRQCSHKNLPLDDRKVDVYRYKMIKKNNNETTDEMMENISRRKNNLIQSFLEAIREVAVDCEIFKNHNMLGNSYKCFKFDQQQQFEKPIGPAYKQDIEIDSKINSGSNSKSSYLKKIRVKKVNAVKKIDENVYSKNIVVLLDENTGIVYDLDFHYPLGKCKILSEENNNKKFDKIEIDNKEAYVIEEVIKIPIVKKYN